MQPSLRNWMTPSVPACRGAETYSGFSGALLGFVVGLAFLVAHPALSSDPDRGEADVAALVERLGELSADADFARPEGPWTLSLPGDHGAHPDARTEAWVIAAHLEDAAGRATGLWFALSRLGLEAEASQGGASPWDMRALHLAELGIARAGDPAAQAEERLARGSGVAGHDAEAREVWVDHWSLTYGGGPTEESLTLAATSGGLPVFLSLVPAKPARSLEEEGAAPLRGFVFTRMSVTGWIGQGESRTAVTGTAWLDRGWGELPLPGGPLAYDRVQVHLDDGSDVSVVRTRRRDGRGAPSFDGLIVDAAGLAVGVPEDRISMRPLAESATDLSEDWEIVADDLTLRLEPLAAVDMGAPGLGGRTHLVGVEGLRGGKPVSGHGTLQVSGGGVP